MVEENLRTSIQAQLLKEHAGEDLTVTVERRDGEVFFTYPVDKHHWLMNQTTESRIRAARD